MKSKLMLISFSLVAVAIASQTGQSSLDAYTKKLSNADGMSVQVTTVAVGGGRSDVSFEMAKPMSLRLDTPTMRVVSNGKDVYTLYKGKNVYVREDASMEVLSRALNIPEAVFFKPFFNANAFESMSMKDAGTLSRRGETLNVVQGTISATEGWVGKLMFGPDQMLRQAEFGASGSQPSIMVVNSLSLNRPADSRFEFKAPNGAKEIDKAAMMESKWYSNIAEALAIGKQTNRLVLVDFMFEGCVWCAKLDADVFSTEQFKEASKDFVLCKIDILKDPGQAEPYNVPGAPDIRFLKPDGSEVHKIGGYVPLDRFLSEMQAAKSKF